MTSQLEQEYMTTRLPGNVKTAGMTGGYSKEINRQHQPTNIQNVIIHRKTITEIITEIHRLKGTIIKAVPDNLNNLNIVNKNINVYNNNKQRNNTYANTRYYSG